MQTERVKQARIDAMAFAKQSFWDAPNGLDCRCFVRAGIFMLRSSMIRPV